MKWIILIIALAGMISCRGIKYVPIETIKTDSIYIVAHQRDSIYTRDSIYIRDKGDTVFIYKDKYMFSYINKTDTLYRNSTDTITQVIEVERELTIWQKFRMNVGGWCMGVLGLFIIWWIITKIKK